MSRPLVTVKTLIAQSRAHGAIELPADALVTPAAQDWLRGSRSPVRRVETAGPRRDNEPAFYVVGDTADPYVQTLLPYLERRFVGLTLLACNGCRDGLLAAVREMCERLSESVRGRGVIIVESGAIAGCIANKYAHVRAAIVLQMSALFALQRELGANVAIVEKDRVSLRQAQAIIEAFLTGKMQLEPAIEAAIDGIPTSATASQPKLCASGS
jgi:ribose 5-phosphate isomerase RpiB